MVREDLIKALGRLEREQTYSVYSAVANALDRVKSDQAQMPVLRIAVLRNFTFDPLIPVIKGEAALMGFYPEIFLGNYDTIAQDVLDPASTLYEFKPDLVILAQWLDRLAPELTARYISLSRDQVNRRCEEILSTTSEFIAALRSRLNAPILVNNFPLPAYPALGILDAQSPDCQVNRFLTLNRELLNRSRQAKDVYLVDYMSLMARVGSRQGRDERHWQIAQAPIGRQALVPFGREYGKFLRSLHGRARKCLVLDCDNVLWGGVVGEDGPEGIQLGSLHPGSSYQAFQREILNLHDRGVILALCSKNNEADVLEVLRSHPEMLLRQEAFSTWQINWDDKATNIMRIAQELNIGLDSIVFVDDSKFECDLVRQRLEQVAVLELSSDPAAFKDELKEKAYFDTLIFSAEDKRRNQMYREQHKRKELQVSAGSLEEYFAKLDMVAQIGLAGRSSLLRVAQLTQKTNQFNLTTRRYSEGDISALVNSPDADVFSLALRDRVSDLGLVGVVIVRHDGPAAKIDTFLLSCRAIGRGAEDALIAYLLAYLKDNGCRKVCADYLITKKNGQVADFYRRCGFSLVSQDDQGSSWQLALGDHDFPGPPWIKIESIKQEVAL